MTTYDTHYVSGCIVNGDNTFRAVTEDLALDGAVVLNWTDGMGSLHNVLLAYNPIRVGSPGGVVDSGTHKLWVAVAGCGAYGFTVAGSYLAPDYVAEKLKVSGGTAVKLAALLTAVRGQLAARMPSRVFDA